MKNLQINDVELTDWEYNSNDLNVYATGVFYVDNGNDSVLVTFNAYVSYDIKYDSNEYTATIKPDMVAQEDSVTIKVSHKEVLEILEVLKKYGNKLIVMEDNNQIKYFDGNSIISINSQIELQEVGAKDIFIGKFIKNYIEKENIAEAIKASVI